MMHECPEGYKTPEDSVTFSLTQPTPEEVKDEKIRIATDVKRFPWCSFNDMTKLIRNTNNVNDDKLFIQNDNCIYNEELHSYCKQLYDSMAESEEQQKKLYHQLIYMLTAKHGSEIAGNCVYLVLGFLNTIRNLHEKGTFVISAEPKNNEPQHIA